MQAVDRDHTSVLCYYRDQFGHFKRKCPFRINTSSSSDSSPFGIISNNNMVNINKSCADGSKTTVEAAEAVCGVQSTRQRPITTPTAVSNNTKPAVTLMWPPPELSASKESAVPTTCPRRMTSQNAPTSPSRQPRYKARQSQQRRPGRRNAPGRFGPLTAACPWPFGDREKPVIYLGGQDEPDLSYMYGGTDGEGEPLYGTALMASGPVAFKHKPSAVDNSVTVLVNRASGDYLADLIIPSLKHRLLNYVLLAMPRKILPAGGPLLDRTDGGILQGLVTDNHGEQHRAWVAILIVPGIGRDPFSVKSSTKRGVVSIFDFDNPRLELSGITVPLRAEDDDLYSLVFDSSADSHGGKELAMNAITNTKLWRRRLRHLKKRSLELRQRRGGNGVVFDGSIDHCDVCAVGNRPQLAHPKKDKHADITAPFRLVCGDLMYS